MRIGISLLATSLRIRQAAPLARPTVKPNFGSFLPFLQRPMRAQCLEQLGKKLAGRVGHGGAILCDVSGIA